MNLRSNPMVRKEPKVTYSTNNTRSEEVATRVTFKQPWTRGQRCIVPKLAAHEQDKRSGFPIEFADVDRWLARPRQEAPELLRLVPTDQFEAGPLPPTPRSSNRRMRRVRNRQA